MSVKYVFAVLLMTLPVCAFRAHAGASLFVDDATVTPPGRCQVESWARTYFPSHETTVVPACNVGGTEFGMGISHYGRPSHGPVFNLGLKHLFRDFGKHAWGVGASLGATWNSEHQDWEGWNLTVPASFSLDPQRRTVVHANIGWNKLRHRDGQLTGGLGIEHVLDERWTMLAEAYADHAALAEAGVRRQIGENASFDVLVGHQGGTEAGAWLTVGFNMLLPD